MQQKTRPASSRTTFVGAPKDAGFTLIEMMVTLGMMVFVIGGMLLFLVHHARTSDDSFDRTDINRSARSALLLMEEKIGMAGLGLPRELAIGAFEQNVDTSQPGMGTACVNTPRLTVASVNYLRQWSLTGTSGSTSAGTIAIDALGTDNPTPGGTSNDTDIGIDEWVYLFTSAAPGGHGLAQVGTKRDAGAVQVLIDNTSYSAAQPSLDLGASSELNAGTGGRSPVMLVADVSTFGVDCADPDHPVLYWEQGGSRVPLAANVALPSTVSGAVGLQFRFLLDTDGDGQPDNTSSPATSLTFHADPATATNDDVVAVELRLQLRSDQPQRELQDVNGSPYRVEEIVRMIQLPNLHTTSTQYVFVDNRGL